MDFEEEMNAFEQENMNPQDMRNYIMDNITHINDENVYNATLALRDNYGVFNQDELVTILNLLQNFESDDHAIMGEIQTISI